MGAEITRHRESKEKLFSRIRKVIVNVNDPKYAIIILSKYCCTDSNHVIRIK